METLGVAKQNVCNIYRNHKSAPVCVDSRQGGGAVDTQRVDRPAFSLYYIYLYIYVHCQLGVKYHRSV